MKLNHVNLNVPNAQESRHFLEKYYGLRSMEGTTDDATFIGMLDGEGFVLVLLENEGGKESIYPESFHIGFLDQSEEKIHEIYQRLKEDGYEVEEPFIRHGGLNLYFRSPGGFTIQISS